MATFDDLDETSEALLFQARDYGLENAGIAADGFVPFAMVAHDDGQRKLLRFVADGHDEAVVQARNKLSTVDDDVHCVALTWDGYLTVEGKRSAAVFVEAFELGRPAGVLIAQRYKRKRKRIEQVGNAALCDHPAPLSKLR